MTTSSTIFQAHAILRVSIMVPTFPMLHQSTGKKVLLIRLSHALEWSELNLSVTFKLCLLSVLKMAWCLFWLRLVSDFKSWVLFRFLKKEVDLGIAEGKVDVNFGLWESNHFRTPLADDAQISVPEKLYAGVVLPDDSNFNVVLDSCWATPR